MRTILIAIMVGLFQISNANSQDWHRYKGEEYEKVRSLMLTAGYVEALIDSDQVWVVMRWAPQDGGQDIVTYTVSEGETSTVVGVDTAIDHRHDYSVYETYPYEKLRKRFLFEGYEEPTFDCSKESVAVWAEPGTEPLGFEVYVEYRPSTKACVVRRVEGVMF